MVEGKKNKNYSIYRVISMSSYFLSLRDRLD
jgi:hypothetical protein